MKPIIFNGEMVKAILEGRKTQTRRVIKPQPVFDSADLNGKPYFRWRGLERSQWALSTYCPYGQVGDRLWVRETWAPTYATGGHEYPDDVCWFEWDEEMYGPLDKDSQYLDVCYRADGEGVYPAEFDMGEIRWRPSIHMPRWASRITLEITGVKVERIQDISESDVEREGTPMVAPRPSGVDRVDFAYLWDSINGKGPKRWDVNPWVWALTFKVVK